jgi:SNF2 family DNA or RNA helicase/uncharacterized Zn finger protein
MAVYGKTWWGKSWLETFNGIDLSNRLPRGKTYTNTGRAYDIQISGSVITAKVTGSRPRPYRVTITLSLFTTKQQEVIKELVTSSPSMLANLLAKKLPQELLKLLQNQDIKLFPSQWKEVQASCSCPDFAIPCKHIAAVIYLLCAKIDKNPFTVFHIHGCDLLKLVSDLNQIVPNHIQKITSIEDLFTPVDIAQKEPNIDSAALDAITIATIPDLYETILTILKSDPPFHGKDFHEILQLVYTHWKRHIAKSLQINPYILLDQLEEDLFLKKWGKTLQCTSFTFILDDTHTVIDIVDGKRSIFGDNFFMQNLISFLHEMPLSILRNTHSNIKFVYFVAQFARKAMQQSAVIPQILQNKDQHIFIRWIPALFDDILKKTFQELSALCPLNLIQYKKSFIRQEEQVKVIFALMCSQYMHFSLPTVLQRKSEPILFELFFKALPKKFDSFSNKEIPSSIQQWLSNLYVSEKTNKLVLAVHEAKNNDAFLLELQVLFENKKTPTSLVTALKKSKNETKMSILADVATLVDFIPSLQQAVDTGIQYSFSFADFVPLFTTILPIIKAVGIIILLPKSLHSIARPALVLNLKSKQKTIKNNVNSFLSLETLLHFDWNIALGDKKISLSAFKTLLTESQGLIRIRDQYVILDQKTIAQLLQKMNDLPNNLSYIDLMHAALSGTFDDSHVELDTYTTSLFDQLDTHTPVSIPTNLKATLRPYQENGFQWLVSNIKRHFGSILADDMGLGKTIQVICVMLYLKNEKHITDKNPILVIAPTSLLSNWQKEIQRFAPDLSVAVHHGPQRDLSSVTSNIFLTSYGLLRQDKKELAKKEWALLVVDEAQNIKNPNTEQTKALKSIPATHKIAMSGTPVENRLSEYWSIFDFANKNYLGSVKKFNEHFAAPIEKEHDKNQLEKFKNITRPFILRRIKSDKTIIKDLPEKIENDRYCTLTTEQAALYQKIVDTSLKKIDKNEGITRKGLVLKLINELKQICNHPSQFSGIQKATIEQSGKMQMLYDIVTTICDLGEKALIFTQYTEMGDLISTLLEQKLTTSIPFLHGSLSRKARDTMVTDFQNNKTGSSIFIVSLKAGGTGLNLTAANHVIHYDLWWNPAVESQATDRAYRIGQKQNVMVYRLISTGTFEEHINQMIQAKKELAHLAVDHGESWITEMSTKELKKMLTLRNSILQ